MSRVWGLRLAFIGAALVVAIFAMRDTLTSGMGRNSRGEYIGTSASQDWLYSFLYEGWGLLAGGVLALFGLYQFIKSRIDASP